MGRKSKTKVTRPKVNEEIVENSDSSEENKISRKDYLRECFIEHLQDICPEPEKKFDINKVCEPSHTRGSFRLFMDGDFKPEDKKYFREILQDLKKEGILIHVAGRWWARPEIIPEV